MVKKKKCEECGVEIERKGNNYKYCEVCRKECYKANSKKWREKNKDKRRDYNKEYYQRLEVKERIKEYQKNNKEKLKVYIKEYRKNNEEKLKVYMKEYRKENKEYLNKQGGEYYENNKEKLAEQMKEYRNDPKNKERINLINSQRRKTDPNFCIERCIRNRVNKSLSVYTKTGKTRKIKEYGINIKAIINHLKPFPKDRDKYHVDHIVPLVMFKFINDDGSTNYEQIRRAWVPENLQWLTVEENLEKGDRLIIPHYNHKFNEKGEEI